MKLTAAQKQKRYRENLKRKGRHNEMKAKNRTRMKNARQQLSDYQREQYRKRDAIAHRNSRAQNKSQSKYVICICIADVNDIFAVSPQFIVCVKAEPWKSCEKSDEMSSAGSDKEKTGNSNDCTINWIIGSTFS
jgi:hypothetical protein